jgi:CheY-like chemotaxis protein
MRTAQRPLDILVADDDPLVAAYFCDLFTTMGHRPVRVGDGQTAVDRALGTRFDLLLMDVEMPRKDGVTACLEILARRPRSVIIMITGSDLALEHLLIAGAKAVLHKPVSTESLRETIALSLGPST